MEQGLHRHGNEPKIPIGKLHGHVDIREIVVVREVDGSLRVRKVVGFGFGFGPGISSFHVLERALMLQQYLHGSRGVRY